MKCPIKNRDYYQVRNCDCDKEECAWWLQSKKYPIGKCAILVIAERLNGMIDVQCAR